MRSIWKCVVKYTNYYAITNLWLMDKLYSARPVKIFALFFATLFHWSLPALVLMPMVFLVLTGDLSTLAMALPAAGMIALSMWFGKRLTTTAAYKFAAA